MSTASYSSGSGDATISPAAASRRRGAAQWNLSAEQEEACVFRENEEATMFANNEAFQNAKDNFVKLIGEVEPVEDREWAVASRPRTALQKDVTLKYRKFEGQRTRFSSQSKRNELRRWRAGRCRR